MLRKVIEIQLSIRSSSFSPTILQKNKKNCSFTSISFENHDLLINSDVIAATIDVLPINSCYCIIYTSMSVKELENC